MKKLLILFLEFSVVAICMGCSSDGPKFRKPIKNAIPSGDTNPWDLRFSAGDIIACDIDSAYAASHILLAMTSKDVMHITVARDGGPPDQTPIVEEPFAVAGSAYKYCKVITQFYDEKYASYCKGKPFSTSEIISRADASKALFRGRTTYYDTYGCNCEHWVTGWRYGVSMTLQLPKLFTTVYKYDNCEASGRASC